MSRSSVRLVCVLGIGLAALAAGPLYAQQGSVVGRATDVASGQPIIDVQVSLVGTNRGALTNSDGRYIIPGLTPGPVSVRATRIGYAEVTVDVTVVAGQTVTADFSLTPMALALTGMVVTATGEQRRVEVGNAIAHVDAAAIVQTKAVANIGDLLIAKTPGVMVIPGTETGMTTRIRIRGINSLSLSRDPIYIIDGVRMENSSNSFSLSVGGARTSRANDLNPDEIESIEVVRGPSAATLYGTDAANGVIVITTKRGTVSKPQWTLFTEQAAIQDRSNYPTAYRGWRTGTSASTTSTPSNTVQCFLTQAAAGTCTQDSVTSFNLVNDPQSTPFGTGYRQQYGLQVRGGSENIRYFLSGEWENENGTIKVPEFDQAYMAAHDLLLTDRQQHQNQLLRGTLRVNLNVTFSPTLDVALSSGYITSDLYLPEADDSGTAGITANIYGGPGMKYNVSAAGDTLYGWREYTPRQIYQRESTQSIERYINSVNANWRPTNWLAFRANVGLDYVGRLDTSICRFGDCTANADQAGLGFKNDNRHSFYNYTVDVGGTATHTLNDATESQTAVGVQFYRSLFDGNYAYGGILPPGGQTVSGAAVRDASETTTESRTLGAYVEERVAWHDRLFVTGAVRSDRNSAFGADFKTVFYPKFSASWVLSEEPWFPSKSWVNQIRLRTAYGASGVQPGTTDAVQYYSATQVLGEAGEATGLVFSTLGNSNLKPERSTEVEVGVDASLFENRLSAEITYYDKTSKDALISRVLPPSLGTGATARFENLGEVSNKGWEALIEGTPLRTSQLEWTVTLNGSVNDNKLVSLGGLPAIVSSSTQQQREGYPINGWWSRRLLSYGDTDGNGIITANEVTVSDTAEYTGPSLPKYEASLANGLALHNGEVRLDAMFDYKGGHWMYNNTERIRCASRYNCSGLINPNASLFEQARVVMVRETSSRSVQGFLEKGDYIRFRELSLTYSPPSSFATRIFGGRTVSATLAARNLGIVWTNYTGVDPEAYFGSNTDGTSEFQAFGPRTYYSLRLSVGF
jgi:TonB-linked SusC/RagA family outer membrane protein